MNAAEITDKLGLHSLRQRAWVSCSPMRTYPRNPREWIADLVLFPTVHPVHLRYVWRWSLRGSGVARHHPPQGGSPVDRLKEREEASSGTTCLLPQFLLTQALSHIAPSPPAKSRGRGCNSQSYRPTQTRLVHKKTTPAVASLSFLSDKPPLLPLFLCSAPTAFHRDESFPGGQRGYSPNGDETNG